jgi:hypothetical protein
MPKRSSSEHVLGLGKSLGWLLSSPVLRSFSHLPQAGLLYIFLGSGGRLTSHVWLAYCIFALVGIGMHCKLLLHLEYRNLIPAYFFRSFRSSLFSTFGTMTGLSVFGGEAVNNQLRLNGS